MMPPWPVSPSMITGMATLRDPSGDGDTFQHGHAADIGEPGICADDAAGSDEQPTSQPAFSMIRAQAALGGCSTDSTRSLR